MTTSGSDLRVVPAALAAWATAAALTHVGPGWSFAVAGVAGVVTALGWRRPWLALPSLCLVAVAVGCGWRIAAVQASPVAELAQQGRVVVAEVQVREDAHVYEGRAGPATVLPVTVRAVVDGDRSWRVRVRATAFVDGTSDGFVVGAQLVVRADLSAADTSDEAATMRVLRWRLVGEGPWWWRGSDAVRDGIRDGVDHRHDQAAALVPALVAGDESGLTDATREDFTRTGLTHLLAVSGANLTIVLAVVLAGARLAGAGRRTVLLLGAATAVAFVLVARPEPSVLRAAVMGSVALVGLVMGSPRAGLRALAWAVLVLVVVDPWLASSAGFVLSVSATAGIVAFAPALARRMPWLPALVAEAVAVPLAAHLACLPMVVALSGEVSLVAVLANVVAAPAVAPATIAGLAAGLVDLVAPAPAAVPGEIAWWSASMIVVVARVGAAAPAASLPWPFPVWTLMIVAPAAGWLLWRIAGRPAIALGLALGLVVAMLRPPQPGWPPDGIVVVACDVGQGDGFVVPTGPSEAMVIDVGQEPAPIDRCLRDLGVRRISLLLFTHADADHVAGWQGAVGGRDVRLVADGPSGGPAVPAARRERLAAGQFLTVGAARIEVLWPRAQTASVDPDARNDLSVVVRVTVRGRRILFTGDLGQEAQRGLARLAPDLAADVLKVAHHGSADTSADLLDRVNPTLALIGVGADNTFGHPAPSALAALDARDIPVWRTDRSGTVAVIDRGDGLRVSVR